MSKLLQMHGQDMQAWLDVFSQYEECPYPEGPENLVMRQSILVWETLKMRVISTGPIARINISRRVVLPLKEQGIVNVGDLMGRSQSDMLKIPSRKSLNEVINGLALRRLTLAPDLSAQKQLNSQEFETLITEATSKVGSQASTRSSLQSRRHT